MSKSKKNNKKTAKKVSRNSYKIESLEPRLLMDASVNDWCTVVVLE
ncbi:LEPR-XLL domain-containing protein [uncultured Fibrobacter sp.]|nr:LEPR-XLL domain-containing protein [uncultured Fibrobacter sp.]MBR6122475.1 LEPR-XLL domain-containing protein [Candidatus Saccharibacteria bacterium]